MLNNDQGAFDSVLIMCCPSLLCHYSISLWDAFMMGISYKLSKFIMSLQSVMALIDEGHAQKQKRVMMLA